MTEPDQGTPSTVMQVLKQRVARKLRAKRRSQKQQLLFVDDQPSLWQPRYYDFNVYSRKKHVEKLNYMHNNPVKRGLVSSPEDWTWSSYRFYTEGAQGVVTVTP